MEVDEKVKQNKMKNKNTKNKNIKLCKAKSRVDGRLSLIFFTFQL